MTCGGNIVHESGLEMGKKHVYSWSVDNV